MTRTCIFSNQDAGAGGLPCVPGQPGLHYRELSQNNNKNGRAQTPLEFGSHAAGHKGEEGRLTLLPVTSPKKIRLDHKRMNRVYTSHPHRSAVKSTHPTATKMTSIKDKTRVRGDVWIKT